jgi:hypothetical protein
MRIRHQLMLVAISLAIGIPASNGAEPWRSFKAKNDFATEEQEILASVQIGFSKDSIPNAPDLIGKRTLVRVTNRPVHIVSLNSRLCRPGRSPDGPHHDHWIDVYVTRSGYSVMKSGTGVYPKGTMILKQKYTDPEGKKTDLFTGMRKREKGYNPETGDWEFFVLNSTRTSATALGRIESCIDCHASFKSNDFVSRDYLAGNGAR